MALEADFLTMTNKTVTIAQPSTYSKYGAPTFGAASTAIPARLEIAHRVVVDIDGVERVSSGTLFILSTTATVTPGTKITLPDGSTPEILRVDVHEDEEGQHHLEVFLR